MPSQDQSINSTRAFLKLGVVFFLYNNIIYVTDFRKKKVIKLNRKVWPILVHANGIPKHQLEEIAIKIYGLDEAFVKKALEVLEGKEIITYEDLDLKFQKFIEGYLNDIRKGKRKRRIYLEMTTACNAKCLMCYNIPGRSDLKKSEWLRILDYISPSILIVTGGEPFVRSDLIDILHFGTGRGHEYFILTNGTLINENIIKDLKEIKDNIIRVRISVHGATSDTHNSITCLQGSFKKVLHSTRLLVENGFEVEWVTTVNKINFNELSKIIKKAQKLSVKYFSAYPVDPMGRCLHHPDILLSASEKAELQVILSNLRDTYADITIQEDALPDDFLKEEDMLYPACKVGLGSFMILSNGDIAICPAIQLPNKINILEIIKRGHNFSQFEQILLQNKYFRELLSTPLYKYTSCGHCGLRYICKGACRGRALQYTNNILGCDIHIRGGIIEYIQKKVKNLESYRTRGDKP